MTLTKQELSILFHTLGLNYKPEPFRNHFVASRNHTDIKTLQSLRGKGLMRLSKTPSFCPVSDLVFYVTDKGKQIAISEKIKMTPKLTRSQKRYQLFLSCEVDETYGEWLKNHYWNDARKRHGCS